MRGIRKGAATVLATLAAGAPSYLAIAANNENDHKVLERGRYMLTVGSCNDCHTPAFGPRDGKVPESEWLLGSADLGFRGPWGTTYAPNLRLSLAKMSEGDWVAYAKALKTRPPMPWFNLNQWSDADLRAFYRFVKSLGPVGDATRAYMQPDAEPKPPYIQWPSPPPR